MALIICEECGKTISSKAGRCPHCGCPVSGNEKLALENTQTRTVRMNILNEEPDYYDEELLSVKPEPVRGDPYRSKTKKKKRTKPILKWILYAIAGLFIITFISAALSPSENDENGTDKTETASEEPIDYNTAEEVFQLDLIENWDTYVGKPVKTSIKYNSYMSSSKILKGSEMREYGASGNGSIEAYVEELDEENCSYGSPVTVAGIVGENKYELKKAVVLAYGDEAEQFASELAAPYEQKLAEMAAQEESEFRNGELSVPSYDELMRYSDSYKSTRIRIPVYVTEVEADGVIFDGTIWGTYQGQKIVLVDNRSNKEPKILTGDSLTVYGYGDGLGTVKTYKKGTGVLGSDLGAEVVSKVEIPKISVVYCDFN